MEKASLETVYAILSTSPKGLTSADAKQRIEQYGRNELVEEEISDLEKFLRFFTGPIAYMIEGAALLSLLMGHWADLTIILVLLFYNAISGFWQERKASDALAALKAGMAPKATALRDGDFRSIDTAAKATGTVSDLAAKGLRALGVAQSTDDGASWSFLDILSMLDPPRDDSKETIEHAKEHGLQVKTVTGDDLAIGSQISGQLGSRVSHLCRKAYHGNPVQPAGAPGAGDVNAVALPGRLRGLWLKLTSQISHTSLTLCIDIAETDALAVVATRGAVIQRTGELQPKRSCHVRSRGICNGRPRSSVIPRLGDHNSDDARTPATGLGAILTAEDSAPMTSPGGAPYPHPSRLARFAVSCGHLVIFP